MSEASYKQAIRILLLEIKDKDLFELKEAIKDLKNEPAQILSQAIQEHFKSQSL